MRVGNKIFVITRFAILAAIPFALTGCFLDVLTSTAIQGKLQKENVGTAQNVPQHAKGTTSSIQLEQAIQAYRAETGEFPPSLDALTPNYLAEIPAQPNGEPYGYDPRTGQLTEGASAAASQGVPPADMQKMQRIRAAINQFGQDTGYYPGSLAVLTPKYMDQVPKTESGKAFRYNPRNGALTHPEQPESPSGRLATPRRGGQGRSGGGAGISPFAESMTGLQTRQELGNMNQSGASSARGHAQGRLNNITQQRNHQQQELLNDMGP